MLLRSNKRYLTLDKSAAITAGFVILCIFNLNCNAKSTTVKPVHEVESETSEGPGVGLTDRRLREGEVKGIIFYVVRTSEEYVSLFEYDLKTKTEKRVARVSPGLSDVAISRDGRFFFYTGPVWDSDFGYNIVIMERAPGSQVFEKRAHFAGNILPGHLSNLFYDEWEKKLYLLFYLRKTPPEEGPGRAAYDKAKPYVFYSDGKYDYVTALVDLNSETYEFEYVRSPVGGVQALSKDYVYLRRKVGGREYLLRKKRADVDSEIGTRSVLLPKHGLHYVVLNGNKGLLATVYEKEYRDEKVQEGLYYIPFLESSAKCEEKVFCRRFKPFQVFTPIQEPNGRGLIVEIFSVERGGYRPLEPGEYTGRVFFLDFYDWRLTWLFDYEYKEYKDWHKARFMIKPGLTGVWQVRGRSKVSFEEMVIMDYYYIHNISPWLDLRLMLNTVPIVLSGEGGY